MADVTLTYKGETIAEMDDSGTKTLRTGGKYCEANIGIKYVKPSGGGGSIVVTEEQDSHGGTIVHITGEEVVLQAKTATPSESRQTITPDSGKTGLSSVVVEAISSTYVGSGVTRKGAATITPTKSQQTIASGQYLTGTQTIAPIPAAYQDVTGVTAAAGDVVSGKKIVNSTGEIVDGDLVIQHYYTGSSAPSASLGSDGDIYLQTGG